MTGVEGFKQKRFNDRTEPKEISPHRQLAARALDGCRRKAIAEDGSWMIAERYSAAAVSVPKVCEFVCSTDFLMAS